MTLGGRREHQECQAIVLWRQAGGAGKLREVIGAPMPPAQRPRYDRHSGHRTIGVE